MGETQRDARLLPALLAAVGLLSSLALAWTHYRAYVDPAAVSFCSFGQALDCGAVALSRWSVLFGVPVPLWGALGFGAMIVAALRRSQWLLPLAAFGAVASVALLVVEIALIGSLCLMCEVVHVVSFALLAVAWRRRGTLTEGYRDPGSLSYVLAPPAGLALALILFLPAYWQVFTWKGDVPFATGVTPEGHPWIGAENPELVVHGYTDYTCPHCAVASRHILRAIGKRPDELRFVHHNNPRMRCNLVGTTQCLPARVAFCAHEQGRFWQADRWLYGRAGRREALKLDQVARDLGLDFSKLEACVEHPDTYARIDAEAKDAQKRGLIGTPMYIVDGKRRTLNELAELLRN